MSLDFFPGQAVVCVNAGDFKGSGNCPELQEGKQYTIRDAQEYNFSIPIGRLCAIGLRLVEVVRQEGVNCHGHPVPNDGPYHSIRFRPVEYKALDVFREIARTTKLPKKSKKLILEES